MTILDSARGLNRRPVGPLVQILAMLCAGGACVLSIASRNYLPVRFLLDDGHIQATVDSAFAGSETQSFRNVAAMYRDLGLGGVPEMAALLTVMIFSVSVFAAARWQELARFGIVGAGVFVLGFVCALAYLAQYSKESVSVLVVLLLLLLPRSQAADIFFAIICVVYGLAIRPYWLIVAGLYLFWRVILPRICNPLWLLLLITGIYALMQVGFEQFVSEPLSAAREGVNESRTDVDVGSLITAVVPIDGVWAGPAGLLMLVLLIVPVQLLTSPSMLHMASGILLVFVWFVAITGTMRLYQQSHPKPASKLVPSAAWLGQIGPGGRHRGKDLSPTAPLSARTATLAAHRLRDEEAPGRRLRAARSAAMLLSFVMVQAIFEPDFGSYLKHLTPLLPLFLTLVPLRRAEVMK